MGPASRCGPGNKCRPGNTCQKLASNGGRPITGTVKCRECMGAKKCQVWPGLGTAMTCGCTARARLAQVSAAEHAAAAQSEEAEDAESEEADADADKGDMGPATSCGPRSECKRNDRCQKLGNDGGKPLSGTLDCKECKGSMKCQVWPGIGSAMTCGCAAR